MFDHGDVACQLDNSMQQLDIIFPLKKQKSRPGIEV
jgi:hypothetical protein